MKRYARIIGQSFRAISANKGRSFLTMLGIIIGIASVITMLAIAQGAQSSITNQISSNGTKNITVNSGAARSTQGPGGPPGPGGAAGLQSTTQKSTLTAADLSDIKAKSSSLRVDNVSGYVSAQQDLTIKEKDSSGNAQTQNYTVIGTEPGYFKIQSIDIEKGRTFTKTEVDDSSKVVVIGSQAAKDIYGSEDPVGKTITLKNDTYTIIGVNKSKDTSGVSFSDPNSSLFAPYSAIKISFSIDNFSSIYLVALDEASVDSAKSGILAILDANHGKTSSNRNFSVSTQKDLLSTVSSVTNIFKIVLGGVASISLLVGGIGIMNIMLVAVTERTKEIGLRKALGARTGDILLQFMVESVLLCLVGGLIGVAIGYGASAAIGNISFGPTPFSAEVTTGSVMLAVSVASIVGVVFGLYPAAKAARKNPIDALRYE